MLQTGMVVATCDDCSFFGIYISLEDMRNKGWAISRNRRNCYCSYCAIRHRNVGRKGVKKLENGSKRL